jgi:hypothetical protein
MKKSNRREFIKTMAFTSIALSTIPLIGSTVKSKRNALFISEGLLLKGFDDEQEESPSIVTDGNGRMWIHALRRISYPENKELISSFYFDGKEWIETDSVTKHAGQYETPTSACAPDGKPIVAWTEIEDDGWVINISHLEENGYSKPHTFPMVKGKSINPVLSVSDKNINWIAWENFYHGKLSIYFSKYENSQWSKPLLIGKGENSCFSPSIAEAKNGDIYIAYGLNQGYHQNIEMVIIDVDNLQIKETIPVAIGGGLENRVNLNTYPAIAFDANDRLWISYESNKNSSVLTDGDNYTGDRSCAILTYENGKIKELKKTGKWLFNGENDQKPTFIKDNNGSLFLATDCGGDLKTYQGWKYRLSCLDSKEGWTEPQTIFKTTQKGMLVPPAIAFDKSNNLWLATSIEKTFEHDNPAEHEGIIRSRLTQLKLNKMSAPKLNTEHVSLIFKETNIKGFQPDINTISTISGHPKISGEKITVGNETYTLVFGNLHEHSSGSTCWPAGTDGSLHDNYRFGIFSEGYNFIGITDHGMHTTEIFWRKSIRIADFYNEPGYFVGIPATEWTLQSTPGYEGISPGSGHYNVIFATSEDARKYIRNKHEIISAKCPETTVAPELWELLRQRKIDCITIPHHTADKVHPLDWDVYDEDYVTIVELYQCRGNTEYPGCPREINVKRHTPTKYKKAYVDYALKEKQYRMGFIGSGDHNNMGVGVAALWVKELSREGIMDALKNRRCFATTGDKIIVDFRINEAISDTVVKIKTAPKFTIHIKAEKELEKIEILRNSKVIEVYYIDDNALTFNKICSDPDYNEEDKVLYYYVRASQKNKAIAWSSPIYVERS